MLSISTETEDANPLYDSLEEKTMTAGIAATNSVHDIEFYKREIEYYSSEDSISQVVSANDRLPRTLAIALVVGLMLGAFAAMFRSYWKGSI